MSLQHCTYRRYGDLSNTQVTAHLGSTKLPTKMVKSSRKIPEPWILIWRIQTGVGKCCSLLRRSSQLSDTHIHTHTNTHTSIRHIRSHTLRSPSNLNEPEVTKSINHSVKPRTAWGSSVLSPTIHPPSALTLYTPLITPTVPQAASSCRHTTKTHFRLSITSRYKWPLNYQRLLCAAKTSGCSQLLRQLAHLL